MKNSQPNKRKTVAKPLKEEIEAQIQSQRNAQVFAGELLPSEIGRAGKDEMNLVEHPFATLWKNEDKGSEIFLQWERPHPTSGKPVKASWRVTGDPELGLPTAADERVYLALMELTREAGFTQIVHFTRHSLIKRLGWPDNAKSNQMLKDAFVRLSAVHIHAENSFWNPRAKQFSTALFHIVDTAEIFAEPPGRKSKASTALPFSYFKWNDLLFQSFANGNIRTLDLTLAFSLKGAIALRLFRFLDKKTYSGRHSFQIDLRELCELHLGMALGNCYESDLKARLKPAHNELIKIGVLKSVRYEPMKTKKGDKVCYTFPAKKAALVLEMGTEKTTENTLEAGARNTEILQRIIALKISPEVAKALLQNVSPETLHEQLDCLDDREPRDHAATFIKAVREGWQLPGKYLERIEAQNRAKEAKTQQDTKKSQQAAHEAVARAAKGSEEEESARLDKLWEQLDISTRQEIETQARQRLGVLGQSGRAQGALVAMRRNLLRERLTPKA